MTEDVLDATELRQAKNGRLTVYGGVTKRLGSTRIHTNVIGTGLPVMGLYGAFDAATGRKIVAIANGRTYHKLASAAFATDFTELLSALNANTRARMVQYRRGATMYLYIACAGLYEFDGVALPVAIAGAPAGALDVAVYKGRLFVTNGTKTVYWSKRLDGTSWAVPNGGFADVETFDAEPLVGLGKVGGSLLLFKEDSIARYTGVSPDDIRIDTDTEGVSADKGAISRMSIVALPEAVAFLSAEGPYIATEAGVEEIGLKLEKEIDGLDKTKWGDALMSYHKGRRELWIDLPGLGGTGNDRRWVVNLRTKSASGSWPLSASTLARFERATGEDTLISGGYDGRVRIEDQGPDAKDDRLPDGTGGAAVELEVDLPELFFNDPTRPKSLAGKKQSVQADLGAAGALAVEWSSEQGAGSTTIASAGAGVKSYPFLLGARGKRIRVIYRESTSEVVTLQGSLLEASLGGSRR